jgi:hypothetical protein
MPLSLALRRHAAWLVLAALVFGALAPSISRWRAATGGVAWVEVCSAAGTRTVRVGTDEHASRDQVPGDDARCGYCLLAAQGALPVPTRAYLPPVRAELASPQASGAVLTCGAICWRPSQARAPPRFS